MRKIVIIFLILNIFFIFPNEVKIDFSKDNNFYQTYNDCALYSLKAVIRILKNEDQKIEIIRNNVKERLKNNYTLPWGLEKYLKKNKIKINILNISSLPYDKKINKLQEILNKKRPVIILIGLGNYQHYITLLGYNDKSFFVYDSNYKLDQKNKGFTIDDNGDLPGNRNIENKGLIALWDKGGMFGLYKNYGLECY